MVQFHAHGEFVRRVNADERRVFDFARDKRLAVFQIKKLPGVIGGRRRIERANPGINHVVRRDWFAGGPDEIRAQMKRVSQPSGEMSQLSARPGTGCAVFGSSRVSPSNKPMTMRNSGMPVMMAGSSDLRFGVVDDGDVGGRFAADAAGRQQTQTGRQKTTNPHHPQRAAVPPSAIRHPPSDRGAFQNGGLFAAAALQAAAGRDCGQRRCIAGGRWHDRRGRAGRHANRHLRLFLFHRLLKRADDAAA